MFSLSEEAREELQSWENLPESTCLPISLPPASQELDTNASDERLGWYYEGQLFSEQTDKSLHINVKELLALEKALIRIGPSLHAGTLLWKVDNVSAQMAVVNQGSNRSLQLCRLTVRILKRAEKLHVQIEPVRLSSEENLLADGASSFAAIADWSLKESVVEKVFRRYGTPDIDLMVTQLSRKVPRFISWCREDEEAIALDSMSSRVKWDRWELPYLSPPYSLRMCVDRFIATELRDQ